MRRRTSSFVSALVSATALVSAGLGCVPQSIFDPLGQGGSESESETGQFVGERPAFIDPSDGSERLVADRRIDLDLRVRGVREQSTVVLLDGVSLGVLPPHATGVTSGNAKLGELTNERLSLHFDGALTTGVHALELFNAGDTFGQVSAPIAIEVAASNPAQFTFAMDAAVLGPALDLWIVGQGEGSHAAWIEGASPPRVGLAPVRADGSWDLDAARRFDLPGYMPRTSTRPAVAVALSEGQIRLAWSAGAAGDRIEFAVYASEADDTSQALASGVALHTAADAFASREWVALAAPRFLGTQLLVPVHAPADTEQASPGDLGLWSATWAAGDTEPAGFTRVSAPAQADLWGLGPLLDMQRPEGRDAALTVVGSAWLRSVEHIEGQGGLRMPDPAPDHGVPLSLNPTNERNFAGVAGALASRTVLSIDDAGGLRLIYEAMLAERASTHLDAAALPPIPSAGPISPGLLVGHPIFAIPYGSGEDVRFVTSNGNRPSVQAGSARCDRIALSPTTVAQLSSANMDSLTLPLLCALDGELRAGELRVQLP